MSIHGNRQQPIKFVKTNFFSADYNQKDIENNQLGVSMLGKEVYTLNTRFLQ